MRRLWQARIGVMIGAMILGGCSGGAPDGVLDPRYVARAGLDGPRLELQVSDGTTRQFVYLAERDGVVTWIDPFGAALLTEGRLLRGTRGLGAGWMASDLSQVQAVLRAGRDGGSAERFHSVLDGRRGSRVDRFICDLSVQRSGLWQEQCTGPTGAFTNRYWPQTSGEQPSEQWAGPRLGMVILTERNR